MPNGYYGTKEEWDRMEAPLREIDEPLARFAAARNIEVVINYHNWPQRQLNWTIDGIYRSLCIMLGDENAMTFHLSVLASKGQNEDQRMQSHWLKKAVPWDEIRDNIEQLLADGVALLDSWSESDLLSREQMAKRNPLSNLMTSDTKQLLDLSHTIEHGLITYKGLPAPIICDYLSREDSKKVYAPGTEFQIGKIEMVANTGTYLDSPFHRYEQGKDLSELPLESLADLDGVVVSPSGRSIGPAAFAGVEIKGKAVLIRTGWDAHWKTDQYFVGHPFLTKDAAQLLTDRGAALVGIDSYNIDDTADLSRPAHSILLGAEIPIVEHMCNLNQLPAGNFRFFAVPVKVRGFGTFPVRAFAIIQS